jgi:putative transposase
MSAARLRLGDWVEFEDERHHVIGFAGTAIRLRSESGLAQLITTTELIADSSFQAAASHPDDSTRSNLDRDAMLDGVGETEKQRVFAMEAHLLEMTTGFRSGNAADAAEGEPREAFGPNRTLRQRVEAKAAEMGLSDRRLWDLLRDWRRLGLWGLVDKRKARPRNPLANLDPRIIEAIREQATAEVEDAAGTVGQRFRRRVQNRLDEQFGLGVVVLPQRDTFRRAVALLVDLSPAGPTPQRRSAANQPDRLFGTVAAQRPGQVVMLDTTPLDVRVFDPVVDDTYGLELTVALDLATRSLLAWRLTAEGTKAIDIGLLLADVMTPEPMRPGWDEALRFAMAQTPFPRLLDIDARLREAAARPVVYPESLLFDHGKPYQSDVLLRACRRLGISAQDSRKLKPTDKPHVESVFRTIRTQFAEHIAGYKGYNTAHRGADPDAAARWTAAEISDFFAEYIVAVYQRRHHSGLALPGFPHLRLSPNEAYGLAVAQAGYVACPTDPNLYYELLPIVQPGRVIHPYGIELNHLTYNAEILYRYRKATSPYPGGKWPIRYDPRNLLHAYFQDPADGSWHLLRWTHALDEHQAFTDTTLREAKRLLAARRSEPSDQDAIARALIELQNRTDAAESWTASDRRRISRDAERARQAAKDRHRAAPAVGAGTAAPLRVVPPMPEPELDLSKVQPAEVWNPHRHEEGADHASGLR